ncbi:hypothetical protein HHK36_028936 [Tetracentron sinense]|uniref:Uncharacterized protein n=1 Tax=Tetracentron sinense TaxID=13715 RepID=A0A834YIA8_TETSI|nr:hypothetical protein HHK36_028936 [Tetracentron sinense]
MEEAKAVQSTTTQIPKPPSTAPNLPPQAPPPQNKKRKLDNVDFHNSNYYKICTVIKELRPYFIEVLRTPDFRNCKAAHEIRKQMKLMMDLHKQMTMDTTSIGKCKNAPEGQPLPGESRGEQKLRERHQEEKPAEQPQSDLVLEKSVEEKLPLPGNKSAKKKPEDSRIPGLYVVGGSAFGWNFVMYPGSKSVYYGPTKESRRTTK